MVLLIIIPITNGYFIGDINPTFSGPNPYNFYGLAPGARKNGSLALLHLQNSASQSLCHREGFTGRKTTPASRFSHQSCTRLSPLVHPVWIFSKYIKYIYIYIYIHIYSWCISRFFCHRTNWTAQPSKASHTSPLPAVKSSLEI